MSKTKRVSIIILNWNCKRFIQDNIKSVLDQTYRDFEVVFVDNGSTDGSIEYLRKLSKDSSQITLLETGENLGYVGGNNFGIEYVLEKGKSKYVVIFNPDIWVKKDWLKNLIKGFSNKEIAITTPKIYLYYQYLPITIIPQKDIVLKQIRILGLDYYALEYKEGFKKSGTFLSFPKHMKKGREYKIAVPYRNAINGEMDVTFYGGSIEIEVGKKRYHLSESGKIEVRLDGKYILQTTGSIFNQKRMVFEDQNEFMFDKKVQSRFVDSGVGAAMAIRTDLLKKFGAYKDKYFMYFDDVELSHRLRRVGYKVRFVEDAVCYHYYWGASGGKLTRTQIQNGVRNRLWFIREYFGIGIYIYHLSRAIVKTIYLGVRSLVRSEFRMYFTSYANALVQSLGKSS